MALDLFLAAPAFLSLFITVWQHIAARRFPIHQTQATPPRAPGVTMLKPLKGLEPNTEACLESWLGNDYAGPMQILFGVASLDDPVCPVVRDLLARHPNMDALLVHCPLALGANAKVSSLIQLHTQARHEIIVVSDADTRIAPGFLDALVAPLADAGAGLVHCFYELANPVTAAMRLEAVAINADFWTQVLQSQTLKPVDFALGAVMATRTAQLREIGGFEVLVDYLADDYQLGNRIATRGHRIVLSPRTVQCWSSPMGWSDVASHQLRWARTIKVCQPAPYFFSILSNSTLWPLLWWAAHPAPASGTLLTTCLLFRGLTAFDHQRRLTRRPVPLSGFWMAPLKDVFQIAIWALAFFGCTVVWRGQEFRVHAGGRLEPISRR
jgi:ceramide glucosyltransferase